MLLDEITARIDGLFLDAVLEMILNFVEIFKDKDSDKNHQTVAESLFSSPEEANVFILKKCFHLIFNLGDHK